MNRSGYLKASFLSMAVLIGAGAVSAQTGGTDVPPIPHHSAVPEPSQLLSLGAVVVIGAGVFLLGRLRKVRK
jgi:hypothetical protein